MRVCRSQFSEKLDSAHVNNDFKNSSDLGHKNMLAGSIITISFCLLIMKQKLIKLSNMSKLALVFRIICSGQVIRLKQYINILIR